MKAVITPIDISRSVAPARKIFTNKLGMVSMTLLVIGAMVGGGAFNLPQNMAQHAGLGAILIAWLVSGLGIFFLARTFQVLADIKPDITAGIYMYSRQGFGKFAGFQVAWGYWLSSAFGNVGFAVLLMDTLNYFFPPYFKGGNTWLAIAMGSSVFWLLNWLVLRGVKSASTLNVIGTIAKFVPIAMFVGILAISMKAGLFTNDFWGNVSDNVAGSKPLGSVLEQVKSTMLVTLWVFIGIEGAVVMSDKSDAKTVSRATLLGFFVTLLLYVLISVLPFGIMSQAQLSVIAPPSMAAILGSVVGKWGEYFINAGVLISVLACWLVWTMLVAELPWAAAKDGTFPKAFAVTNKKGSASVSLWVSTAVMQAVMILMFFSHDAWNVMLSITGVMILPAYIGATGFLWRVMVRGHYPANARIGKITAWVSSVLGTVYGFWLVYAAGLEYMIAGAMFFALGNLVFIWARKEHAPTEPVFNTIEMIVAAVLLTLGVLAIWMLFSGHLMQVYAP
ncbi:basic amino acid/polyamine antiporter [Pseudomonas sp. KU26590]|uniref:basic amino acid/polyamine antiporter n=1 Tax=Pseudomonas sp. KU26590 TaxID=2991051 RepID=UPI00223E1B43|nr:basic amino acid/polyamine antiporter [Pseudomonas sp. KU26590]UZJ57988.1 basic amino acid/polyamine antiporter [Pseudomonas sp. KU26590]